MRLIDADALKKALAEMWYESAISITGVSVAELIDNAPTIVPSADIKSCGASADKSTDQNVADVPSGDTISREELLKKLDRQIEWEEANAIPYEDADGGCILGLKKARKYVKLASSTEKPNANDCDLISREDAIEAIQNAYCKPCKERGDDHNEVRCRVCEYDNAIIQIDALPSAEPKGANLINRHDVTTVIREECLKCNNLTNADLLGRILALPTSRQTDCTDFIMWLIEVVLDEEDWELNAVSYGEIIARKLKKLGLLEVKDGYYIRSSADRPNYNLETIADIVKQLGHLDGCIADMCDRQNGEWLYLENEPYSRCSVCGAYIDDLDDDKYKFCPYCGAIMKGGQDE